jgi:DNA ligase-associated metallophosphoesterase
VTAAPVHVGGQRLLLDPAGVLVWPEERVLVVADLHLEKATHFAAKGQLLPPWDTAMTLDRLGRAVRHWSPRTVIALGDSFHDAGGSGRMAATDGARLSALSRGLSVIWVLGNHDPSPPAALAGDAVQEVTIGPLTFRHEPVAGARGEIAGHLHPKASVPARGCLVSRPCFVADAHRVLLPAFGAFTGGLDVRNLAIARLFPRGARAFLLGRERVFSFTLAQARAVPA